MPHPDDAVLIKIWCLLNLRIDRCATGGGAVNWPVTTTRGYRTFSTASCHHLGSEVGLRANTFTPCTPYLRAVFSLDVARKQSKRAVIRTSSSPICVRYSTSSASGR